MKKFVHYSALLCTHSYRLTEEMLMATGWKDDDFLYGQADCLVIKPTKREKELMILAAQVRGEMMPLDRLQLDTAITSSSSSTSWSSSSPKSSSSSLISASNSLRQASTGDSAVDDCNANEFDVDEQIYSYGKSFDEDHFVIPSSHSSTGIELANAIGAHRIPGLWDQTVLRDTRTQIRTTEASRLQLSLLQSVIGDPARVSHLLQRRSAALPSRNEPGVAGGSTIQVQHQFCLDYAPMLRYIAAIECCNEFAFNQLQQAQTAAADDGIVRTRRSKRRHHQTHSQYFDSISQSLRYDMHDMSSSQVAWLLANGMLIYEYFDSISQS
eukprot:CAMPEP_0198133086 /NCGR_PEP_ID=MMETSP1442-20131203/59383_1 /TAXON_ID= /ORGANISM="Craspedostauros australis, Strain CCMP3328" /LENGTH=325 /DNA_ID=CAMNT_0043794191 /DNA_START=1418 /DNA_END=2392 /DNA_ORIENTATION=-